MEAAPAVPLLALLSVAPHPALPAILPGVMVVLSGDNQLTFSMPATPMLLRKLAECIADGALVPQSPGGGHPTFEQIEAHIQAQHTALCRRLEAALTELECERVGERVDRLAC